MTDEPFTQSGRNDYRWTDRAFDLLTEKKLAVTVSGKGESTAVQATGECPRCQHDVAYTHVEEIALPDGSGGLGGSEVDQVPADGAYVPIEVVCWCDQKHPGRPDSLARGCGIVFAVEIWINRD